MKLKAKVARIEVWQGVSNGTYQDFCSGTLAAVEAAWHSLYADAARQVLVQDMERLQMPESPHRICRAPH